MLRFWVIKNLEEQTSVAEINAGEKDGWMKQNMQGKLTEKLNEDREMIDRIFAEKLYRVRWLYGLALRVCRGSEQRPTST
jgi:hypothetical protein